MYLRKYSGRMATFDDLECLCHQAQTMVLMVQIDNCFIFARWKGVFCYFILKMFAKYDNRAI